MHIYIHTHVYIYIYIYMYMVFMCMYRLMNDTNNLAHASTQMFGPLDHSSWAFPATQSSVFGGSGQGLHEKICSIKGNSRYTALDVHVEAGSTYQALTSHHPSSLSQLQCGMPYKLLV